jgi:hypothetical protein
MATNIRHMAHDSPRAALTNARSQLQSIKLNLAGKIFCSQMDRFAGGLTAQPLMQSNYFEPANAVELQDRAPANGRVPHILGALTQSAQRRIAYECFKRSFG